MWEITLSATVQCLQFLCLVLQIPVISKLLMSALFPILPPFNQLVSYICNIVKLFCHLLHSIMGSPDLNDFFNCIHQIHCLFCRVLLEQMHSAIYLHYIIPQISFTALKDWMWFTFSAFPFPKALATTDLFTISVVLPFPECLILGILSYVFSFTFYH